MLFMFTKHLPEDPLAARDMQVLPVDICRVRGLLQRNHVALINQMVPLSAKHYALQPGVTRKYIDENFFLGLMLELNEYNASEGS